MERQNISSGAKWENIVGYSRAVRIGNFIEVSGTTAINEHGDIIGENNAYEQTFFIIQKIEKTLIQADATLADVIRTRIYVTDILNWEQVAQAHVYFFGDVKPTSTMIQVSALIDPKLLVEIEVSAHCVNS